MWLRNCVPLAFVKINIFEYKTSVSLLKFWKKVKLLSYGKILGK